MMTDITPELILCGLKEVWSNMADRLEELVYTDESKEMIDIINVLLIGWILLGLIVYIVGNIIANQIYKNKKEDKTKEETEKKEDQTEVTSAKPPLPSDSSIKANNIPKENESKCIERLETTLTTAFPSATGLDPDAVRWTDDLLHWIRLPSTAASITQHWIRCLNENSQQNEIKVNFEKLQMTTLPSLSDIKADLESEDIVVIYCNIKVDQMNFTANVEQESENIKYDIIVRNLSGKLKIVAKIEEMLFLISFVEHPELITTVNLADTDVTPTEDKIAKKELLIKTVNELLATTKTDINFKDNKDIPQYQKTKPGIDLSKLNSVHTTEKLILKSIKASNLGGSKGCIEPYCVVELDDPGQKFETVTAKNTNSPLWNQQFTFNLNNISSEVLFEIYDKGKEVDNFLGLGIVSLEELSKNSSQRHIIPLQSRPLEKDEITGALTVEFSFVDGEGRSLSGIRSGRIVETNSRVTPGGTVITTTTIKRTVDGKEQETIEESVADTALRELESRGKNAVPTSKSTLIIHSVTREAVHPTVKVKLDKNGRWHEVSQDSPSGRSGDSTPSSPPSKQEGSSTLASTSSSASEKDEAHRSRPKEKRSLMRTLRRRLSLRKTRSKSMEQKPYKDESSHPNSRSVSADRSRSMPSSRETSSIRSSGNAYLNVPGSRTENDSTRSSISEASGISGSSTRTYISDKSTLVIEANENGVMKRYLIPASLATRNKWRKKGLKLHVYNDHVFIAKHFSGSVICQACSRHLSRRPGKQGYECRDCNLQCHKPCHVKVEGFCPNSTINTMEVEYVQDTSKPKQS